jgi:F-type H+-transporting ATPase subunit epsilon|tara:strand:+ start:31130 stop:31363 length:234 start_codon:yes stop_codon:yes gene_type:complete
MLHLTITTFNKILFEGEVRAVTCPGAEGELTVLANHMPLITTLKKGSIRVLNQKEPENFDIEKGILEVNGSEATILV